MGDSLCRRCRQLLPQASGPSGGQGRQRAQRCRRCGCRLAGGGTPRLAGLVAVFTLAGLGLAASPDLMDWLARQVVRSSLLNPSMVNASAPDPKLAPLALVRQGLVPRLAKADEAWIPTREPLPDGGTRYAYQRRPGDPELSVSQIQALIAHPPDHRAERQAILKLLGQLQSVGVQIALAVPLKPGSAAEWDHEERLIRINPQILDKGTVDFLRLLNHESIHVAQSCHGGQLWASPKLLGLSTDLPVELETRISESVQASAPGWERELEREAYANQHLPDIGSQLVREYCQVRRLHPQVPTSALGQWLGWWSRR